MSAHITAEELERIDETFRDNGVNDRIRALIPYCRHLRALLCEALRHVEDSSYHLPDDVFHEEYAIRAEARAAKEGE
jgi:hypothetical protein